MARAHLFTDGGGLVTGTHDVDLARRLIVEQQLGYDGLGYTLPLEEETREVFRRSWRLSVADASRMFQSRKAKLEVGRIVPTGRDPIDCAWYWRDGYELGKPGVTRAVVWYPAW